MPQGNEVRKYRVDIQGRLPEHRKDALLKKGFVDLSKLQYGHIYFEGTEAEFDEWYGKEFTSDDHTFIKVIGIDWEKITDEK